MYSDDLFNKEKWGPDIRRADRDEQWVISELQKRTPKGWHWVKCTKKVGFDLACVRDMFDLLNPVGQVEVEGTPLYTGRPDTWTEGNQYPPAWHMGLTIPSRKVEDYIIPWVNNHDWGEAYYLKCNHTHTEAFGIKVSAFLHGRKLEVPHDATPTRLRKHDMNRRDIMIALPLDYAQFGVPYVFDWIMGDLEQYLR